MSPNEEDYHALHDADFMDYCRYAALTVEPIDGKEQVVITQESLSYRHLFIIDHFVETIKRSENTAFAIQGDDRHLPIVINSSLQYGFKLLGKVDLHFDEHKEYSNNIQLFRESMDQLGLMGITLRKEMDQYADRYAWEWLNTLILLIRKGTQSKAYQQALSYRKFNAKRRYSLGVKLVNDLFDRHEKLMVIRLDLSFTKEQTERMTLEEVQEYRKRFLNNLRNKRSISEHMVGYICRLDHSERKGFHFHYLFFFNGQYCQRDKHYSKLLADYWINDITMGKGLSWKCNLQAKTYEKLFVGTVRAGDTDKREHLLRFGVGYLSKVDQFMRVKLSANMKSFYLGGGSLANPNLRGRPRQRSYARVTAEIPEKFLVLPKANAESRGYA